MSAAEPARQLEGASAAPNPGFVLVFAKAPVPGAVKTRLARAVGAEAAARLAGAFLVDTCRMRSSLPAVRLVLVLSGDPRALPPALRDVETWPQSEGDLGDRLTAGLARALSSGPWAIAVGGDSPGLSRDRLVDAERALAAGDSVIGPCDDGGFYLLGLRDLPDGLLSGLPWSQPTTLAATLARLRERGRAPVVLPPWFDVDRVEDLDRLCALAATGQIEAPETTAMLRRLGLFERAACESR